MGAEGCNSDQAQKNELKSPQNFLLRARHASRTALRVPRPVSAAFSGYSTCSSRGEEGRLGVRGIRLRVETANFEIHRKGDRFDETIIDNSLQKKSKIRRLA